MRKNTLTAAKTFSALAGNLLMMGGGLVLSESSLLRFFSVDEDSMWYEVIGITSFFCLGYVMIFSRGLTLWNHFSTNDNLQQTIAIKKEEPNELVLTNVGKFIGGYGIISTISYGFFSAFAASQALLSLTHTESTPLHIVLWGYTLFSMATVYFTFSLPRAINNGKDLYKLLCCRNTTNTTDRNYTALSKTVILTLFGTISFSALSHFMLQKSIETMPILKNSPSIIKSFLIYLIATNAAIMFALSKSLECYQLFSRGRHFQPNFDTKKHYLGTTSCFPRAHQLIGNLYLLFILSAYFRVNVDLLENLGAEVSLTLRNTPYFMLAILFSLSSTFTERVFSYDNMIIISKNFFSSHLSESLLAQEDIESQSDRNLL